MAGRKQRLAVERSVLSARLKMVPASLRRLRIARSHGLPKTGHVASTGLRNSAASQRQHATGTSPRLAGAG
eukprot:4485461-Prymnesium_polylepis.1